METLTKIISGIDHKGYKAYKQLQGKYDFGDYYLFIDRVQGDPFAAPSKLRIRVPQSIAGFPEALFSNMSRKTALEDFITRAFNKAIKEKSKGNRGTGKSGSITIDHGGQEILRRASCLVTPEYVEARFYAGLPARGRTILGGQCLEMLTGEIPGIVISALFYDRLEKSKLQNFIEVCEDQDYLRKSLKDNDLISFIKNNSILPRRSGVSDSPLQASEAIAFKSPPELEVILEAPNIGKVSGMGVPPGITLIIGGGFHGKTTLLKAIERGVYNHIPGDGREYAVTVSSAVKIRAEEGRSVRKVNISPFISNLRKKNPLLLSLTRLKIFIAMPGLHRSW